MCNGPRHREGEGPPRDNSKRRISQERERQNQTLIGPMTEEEEEKGCVRVCALCVQRKGGGDSYYCLLQRRRPEAVWLLEGKDRLFYSFLLLLLFPPLLPTRFLGVIVPLPLLARAAMSDERGRGGRTHTRRLTDEGGRRHIRQRSFYQGYKLANLPAQKAQKRLIC